MHGDAGNAIAHSGGVLRAMAAALRCTCGRLPKPPAPRLKLVISFSAMTFPVSAHLRSRAIQSSPAA